MKFLQPREIKTDVLDRGLGFVDGKVRAIQLQQLGWTGCAQFSPNIAGKSIANFSPSLLTVKAPLSRVSNPTVWNPACTRFNITQADARGRMATEANLATGRRPAEIAAIVLDTMKAVSERLFSAATLGSKASSNQS
jgi:hypothetical protein